MNGQKTVHYITGNTYEHRETLKALGLRWEPEKKAWCTTDTLTANKARDIIDPNPYRARNEVSKYAYKKNRHEFSRKGRMG
jgi:hypothetical protein